jgi:hypothetical protein
MWNVSVLEDVAGTGVSPIVQVSNTKLLAYDSHAKEITKNLVPYSQVKRVNEGLKCGCCKSTLNHTIWTVGGEKECRARFEGVLQEGDLNYARLEKCGHEMHLECLLDSIYNRDSCECPICGKCSHVDGKLLVMIVKKDPATGGLFSRVADVEKGGKGKKFNGGKSHGGVEKEMDDLPPLLDDDDSDGGIDDKKKKVEVVKEKDAVSVDEKVFHCGVCDLTVTNQASLDQHLAGKAHSKRVKKMKKSGSGMIGFLMFRIF